MYVLFVEPALHHAGSDYKMCSLLQQWPKVMEVLYGLITVGREENVGVSLDFGEGGTISPTSTSLAVLEDGNPLTGEVVHRAIRRIPIDCKELIVSRLRSGLRDAGEYHFQARSFVESQDAESYLHGEVPRP
jgi:hypothetical protein